MSLVLWNCNDDDDPGLDRSAKFSLLLNMDIAPSTKIYAIIADTSGNVVEWKEVQTHSTVEFGYPADPKQATITIAILTADGQNQTAVDLYTYSGVAPGSYTYTQPADNGRPVREGEFKFTIADFSEFGSLWQYMTGNYEYIDYKNEDDLDQFSYGLYDDEVNNFILFGSTAENNQDRLYMYFEDINDGDSLGVSPESLTEFDITPLHVVTYPEHALGIGTYVDISGVNDNGGTIGIDTKYWQSNQVLKIAYPDIEDLFPGYQTSVYSGDGQNTFYSTVRSTDPTLTFSNLNASMDAATEISTKKIAVNVSGDGEVIYLWKSFGPSGARVYYNVLLPAASNVRVGLPQFPDDLLEKLPSLSALVDQKFSSFSVDQYGMSYQDFFKFRIENRLDRFPYTFKSKEFYPVIDDGRITLDPRAAAKKYSQDHHGKGAR